MTSESMWKLFRQTGNIIFYCLAKRLEETENEGKTA